MLFNWRDRKELHRASEFANVYAVFSGSLISSSIGDVLTGEITNLSVVVSKGPKSFLNSLRLLGKPACSDECNCNADINNIFISQLPRLLLLQKHFLLQPQLVS